MVALALPQCIHFTGVSNVSFYNFTIYTKFLGDPTLWVNVTDTDKPYEWISKLNRNREGERDVDCVSMTSKGYIRYIDCTEKITYACEGKSHYSNSQNQVARGSFVPATTKHDHRRIKYRTRFTKTTTQQFTSINVVDQFHTHFYKTGIYVTEYQLTGMNIFYKGVCPVTIFFFKTCR